MSVGSVQSVGPHKPPASRRNFSGCLENLLYNSHSLIQLAMHKDLQVTAVVSRQAAPQCVCVCVYSPEAGGGHGTVHNMCVMKC